MAFFAFSRYYQHNCAVPHCSHATVLVGAASREGYIIETLRVSGNSRPNSVAGAIAALLRSERVVEVQAIGPQAVNQAVKAIAIARSYIELDGLDLSTQPSFVKLELQDEERTAVRFNVRALTLATSPSGAEADAPDGEPR